MAEYEMVGHEDTTIKAVLENFELDLQHGMTHEDNVLRINGMDMPHVTKLTLEINWQEGTPPILKFEMFNITHKA